MIGNFYNLTEAANLLGINEEQLLKREKSLDLRRHCDGKKVIYLKEEVDAATNTKIRFFDPDKVPLRSLLFRIPAVVLTTILFVFFGYLFYALLRATSDNTNPIEKWITYVALMIGIGVGVYSYLHTVKEFWSGKPMAIVAR